MYGGRDLVSLARPKSAILTSSGPVHSKFSGFMSRWKNPVQGNIEIHVINYHAFQKHATSCKLSLSQQMSFLLPSIN